MITLKIGDITKEDTGAIVNAANTGLLGGGGVDGAIHRAAGKSLIEECRKIGGCPTGEAVITNAGNLKKIKKIIHAVGPIWQGGVNREAEILEKVYRSCFKLALKHHLKSIAFPAISTGVYGYPKAEATEIALKVGIEFERSFQDIRYICFTHQDLALYSEIYEKLSK